MAETEKKLLKLKFDLKEAIENRKLVAAARFAHELEKAMKNLIADVDVSGYSQKEIEVYTAGNKYRVYVLLEYSDAEATKIIMNRIRKDRILYSKLKATKGWRELDDAVEKSHKDDDSNARALHELEFGKSGESS